MTIVLGETSSTSTEPNPERNALLLDLIAGHSEADVISSGRSMRTCFIASKTVAHCKLSFSEISCYFCAPILFAYLRLVA